jgi:thymidine phosphorylase
MGLAVIELGGGRRVAADKIDHAVGLDHLLGKNFRADNETPLAMIHAADEEGFERAAKIVKAAYKIGGTVTELPPILEKITA